jgi:Flp pilus assembly protein TadD
MGLIMAFPKCLVGTGSWLPLVCVLACASCTHQVQTASRGVSQPAVPAVKARRVENAADAGEGDLEARALRRRLAANADDLDARMALAQLYSRRGLPDLALEHYRLAAARFPDSLGAARAFAQTLREMGETPQALKAVEEFLARHPGASWEMLSLEGILEDELGRWMPAEEAHRAALALSPGRSALHNNLGYNLLLQGQAEAAAAEFRRAIEIDPRAQIAHNNLGAALAAQSHAGEALAEWQRSGDPAAAHNNLAAVLMEQGHYAEARAELETALGYRRNFPAALANLRLVAEKDGRPAVVPSKRSASKRVKAVGVAASVAGAAGEK